jgi:hypothetical protein
MAACRPSMSRQPSQVDPRSNLEHQRSNLECQRGKPYS